jgi:hypothetical protein
MRVSFATCQLEGFITGFNGFPFNIDRYFLSSKKYFILSLSLSLSLPFPSFYLFPLRHMMSCANVCVRIYEDNCRLF